MTNAISQIPWQHLKFDAITIVRPLKHFGESVGLMPGVAAVPKRQVLIQLWDNMPSEKRLWRSALGDVRYRTFANWVTGRHKPSANQVGEMAEYFGQPPEFLLGLVGKAKNGELVPNLWEGVERIYAWLCHGYATATANPPPCSCCDEPLWLTPEKWWSRAAGLSPEAARFADFPLQACVSAMALRALFEKGPARSIADVFASQYHPMRDWLSLVCKAYGVASVRGLYQALPYDEGDELKLARLMKFSSGHALPTHKRVKLMVADRKDAPELRRWFTIAMHLCATTDFIQAASPQPIEDAKLKCLAKVRLRQLWDDHRIALRILAGAKIKPAVPPADPFV